jgi:hypothetical protein
MHEIITIYGGELITTEEARYAACSHAHLCELGCIDRFVCRRVRKHKKDLQSRRYLMRISDSDFLVDGWHYASGISETPGSTSALREGPMLSCGHIPDAGSDFCCSMCVRERRPF